MWKKLSKVYRAPVVKKTPHRDCVTSWREAAVRVTFRYQLLFIFRLSGNNDTFTVLVHIFFPCLFVRSLSVGCFLRRGRISAGATIPYADLCTASAPLQSHLRKFYDNPRRVVAAISTRGLELFES